MNLTNQMAQLRLNIDSLRDARASLLRNLADDRATQAATVSQMVEGFQTARADMADNMQHKLHAFTSHLRQHVADLRGEVSDDLAGARAAWLGKPGKAARTTKTYAEASASPSAAPYTETAAPKSRKSKRY